MYSLGRQHVLTCENKVSRGIAKEHGYINILEPEMAAIGWEKKGEQML
jgi:hypothetical protein